MLLKEYLMGIYNKYTKKDIVDNYIKISKVSKEYAEQAVEYLYDKITTPQVISDKRFKSVMITEKKLRDVKGYFCMEDEDENELIIDITLLEENNVEYATDFVKIEEMLISPVNIKLDTYTDLDALSFYMDDCFFYGITDEIKDAILMDIVESLDEAKSDKGKTYTLDELKKELGLDEED